MTSRALPVCLCGVSLVLACSSPSTSPAAATGGRSETGGASTAAGATSVSPAAGGGATSTTSGGAVATGGSGTAAGGTSTGLGSGGAVAGSTSNGGAAAGDTSTGGSSPAGGAGGSGGALINTAFARPLGTIANGTWPASMINVARANWKTDLVSPNVQYHHHINQPSVVNGYLVAAGNEEFWIYDVKNPASPTELSAFFTPNRCATCGGKGEGEAESHTVSFARIGEKFYAVTTGGRGVDTWDITNASAPVHLQQLGLTGIDYGDYTSAVWGLSWQGQYIYVGSTNNGIDILNATDPANVKVVTRIPTSAYGGVSAGPVDAIGNVLIVMTPKESGGIATLDISDPEKPVALDSMTLPKSYIAQFYRHSVYMVAPSRSFDVLSDPLTINGGSTTPIGTLTLPTASEYMSFSDDYMFVGMIRPNGGATKVDIHTPKTMTVVNRIWGRLDQNGLNDDQFTIALGPLLVLGDDQNPYAGFALAVHSTTPDTTAPVVDTVIPKDKTTGVNVKSRIGFSFTDNIELATVNGASVIVRPVGGQPLAGRWGIRMGVLNFDPDQDLQAATTYEVILPKGGLTDLVGNALAQDFKSTFTTK